MRKAISLTVALALAIVTIPVSAQSLDVDVQKGIAQVDDGDYDGAILTLDNAARRLTADKAKANDLAQAYLYLGIAYIGKGHEAAARAKFKEAIAQIKDLSLSPDRFPPKVINAFEAAKAEEAKESAASKPGPSASGSLPPTVPEKKKGGGKAIFIVGGLAAAGGVAALAGGGGSSAPKTANSDSRSTLTFNGTLPFSGGSYECFTVVATKPGNLDATVTWTNGQIAFGIGCQEHDSRLECTGTYNRTSNTSAVYAVAVTQKTYDICPYNNDSRADTYSLVVRFP